MEIVFANDKPVITTSLSNDIKGDPIIQDQYYYLKIVNNQEDLYDALDFYDNDLCGRLGLDEDDDLIVTCIIEDNITYLMHDDKYFCVSSEKWGWDGVMLSKTKPSIDQRLQYCVKKNSNSFKLVYKNKYMDIEWVKASTGVIEFENRSNLMLFLEKF